MIDDRADVPVSLIQGAFVFFAVGALLGAGMTLLGPAVFIRALGLLALVLALIGCAVQIVALRMFAPETFAALRKRLAARSEEAMAGIAPRPAVRIS